MNNSGVANDGELVTYTDTALPQRNVHGVQPATTPGTAHIAPLRHLLLDLLRLTILPPIRLQEKLFTGKFLIGI